MKKLHNPTRVLATLLLALAGIRASGAEFTQRLVNLSSRAPVSSGMGVAVAGFSIGAGAPKQILIRAAGPALAVAPFSIGGTISDPKLDLYDGAGNKIATNDNWNTAATNSTSTAVVAGATTATTFSSVGAFSFATNSKDAAMLVTLPPGNYTAQVSGVGTATGIAIIEIYDVTGSARLMNLSTRAQVNTGNGIVVSGLVIAPGDGHRQILVRAAGPALAAAPFNIGGTLADPTVSITDSTGIQVASNDDWSSGNNSADAMRAGFTAAGAFPFAAGSKDAALITDLAPGAYTIQVSGNNNTTGLALVEVYDITPDNLPTVTVAATSATTDTKGGAPGTYTFTRSGASGSPLTIYYQVSGSATPGVDYSALSGTLTFPAGASTATLNVTPRTDGASDAISRTASVALANGAGYSVGTQNSASVTIFYNPGTNYLAALRASTSATSSTAYGTASIQLSGDGTFAIVNANFSNLSSPETVAYLRYGNPGDVGTEVLRLPTGQVSSIQWNFVQTGTLSPSDLVQALKNGQIFLSIESATFPGGELRGSFIQNTATLAFAAPAAAPAIPDNALSGGDAARFLTQATFGPSPTDLTALTGKHLADLNTWITAQIALPASSHDAATDADFQAFTKPSGGTYGQANRQAAWWKLAVTGPDQLRQRVGFALSEIFVVSDVNGTLAAQPSGTATYYDVLVNGAFGNFRDLLQNVTLHPIMGTYLSSLRNAKATYDAKTGALLTSPDENYAREVMQLFTIGLNQLQPDGTLKLDPTGLPIPTYNQATITEMARVFTGWAFYSNDTNPNFRGGASDYVHPMILFPAFHDDGTKTIVGGVQIPANEGGAADLKLALDALYNHPNTGPFIARQLIQRLVTSNPSPGYIYRVAQVFANNGSGVRGDMGAVVRAVLMDYEARSGAVAANASFGKLKEPILRATALLRALNGGANNGRFNIPNPETNFSQAALRAPTVFNFFAPDYVQAGSLASAGLYAPEFQILTDTTAISIPNQLWTYIYGRSATSTNPNEGTVGIQIDSLISLARTPAALVDQVNLLVAGGALPKTITDRMVTAITAMPLGTGTIATTNSSDVERVRSAIYLAVSVPQGAIQQ